MAVVALHLRASLLALLARDTRACETSHQEPGEAELASRVRLGQRAGVDVLPRHFYSQVPDVHELRQTTAWRRPRRMDSVRGHQLKQQIQFAERICQRDYVQHAIAEQVYERACADNGEPGYGPIEALFLYAFIRSARPQRIVQAGAGVSTAVILMAARDAEYRSELRCVDPFPTEYLQREAAGGHIQLVARPAQDVIAEQAASLRAGDLLFVNSTHTVKPGSEVNVIVLDVLPSPRRRYMGALPRHHVPLRLHTARDERGSVLSAGVYAAACRS